MPVGASASITAEGHWEMPGANGAEAAADAVLAKSDAEQWADALLAKMIAAREEQGR